MSPPATHVVQVLFRKWDGTRHWAFAATPLGQDEHGTWLGGHAGAVMCRPGVLAAIDAPWVTLVPDGAYWAANFHPAGHDFAVYVDVTTPAEWSADRRTVSMVDVDLDVIRFHDGRVLVDDEDEFADHAVLFGYPADLVTRAQESCDEVRDAVASGAEPYGDVGRSWLARHLTQQQEAGYEASSAGRRTG